MSDLNMSVKEALTAAIEIGKKGITSFRIPLKAIEKFNQEFLSGENVDPDDVIAEMTEYKPQKTIDELFKIFRGRCPWTEGQFKSPFLCRGREVGAGERSGPPLK
ncbi:MAG: hypothetical protein JSU85_02075 [Candidatus Zixiibacteriota bacterium]|nr:MAG: hypothetical protein JSU85_02075 [candidate division Zixibacteria bacterium]